MKGFLTIYRRELAGLFLAPVVALGGTLTAQSLGLQITPFGKPSGVPASAVHTISLCAIHISAQQIQLTLSGRTAGT